MRIKSFWFRVLWRFGKSLRLVEKLLGQQKTEGCFNGQSSCWCDVISSAPQGSVLGPILFNIYVNVIASQVDSNILQFAENLKMF